MSKDLMILAGVVIGGYVLYRMFSRSSSLAPIKPLPSASRPPVAQSRGPIPKPGMAATTVRPIVGINR